MKEDLSFPKGSMGHAERKRRKLVGIKREKKKKNEGKETDHERAL